MSQDVGEILYILRSKEYESHFIVLAEQAIFECVRCGGCCQGEDYASINDHDIEQIARVKGCSFKDARDRFTDPDPKGRSIYRMLKNVGAENFCVFFDEANNNCMVYESRPSICKMHPMINFDGNFNLKCPGTVNLLRMLVDKKGDSRIRRRIERLKRKSDDSLKLKKKLYIYELQFEENGSAEEMAALLKIRIPFDDDSFKRECIAYISSKLNIDELEGYGFPGTEEALELSK